tara:strand:+ start:866 stop:2353 length:1488 start_codon:yes stop_codon:yes gene_type:complete
VANLTRIKILTTGSTTTAPANIKTGELAYSYVTGTQANNGDRLYVGTGAESGGVASSVDLIGGKYFTQMLDHVHGTTTASSALIVDANKHVSDLNIGSLALEASGGSGQVVTSIVTAMPGSPTDAQLITAQGVKEFIDTLDLSVSGDSGSIAIDVFSGAVSAEETLGIIGTANEIETVASGNNVTIGLPTNITVAGEIDANVIDVASAANLASAKVEDLTNNRVVIAGTGGELEDDANFTFDGTSLNVGGANFSVAHASGNTVVGGTLQVNGNVTLGNASSDTVQTQGNLTVGGNLTVSGTTTSVNSTTTTLTDPVIELAKDTSSADGLDRGVRFKWHNGSAVKDGFFGFDIQTQRFSFTPDEDLSGGENASAPWGDLNIGDIYGTGATLDNVRVAVTAAGEIDTSSGNLTLDSAGGTVVVDDNLNVTGTVTLTNDLAVTEGGTGVSAFTDNGVLYGDGANALDVTAASSANGSILQADSGGAPAFSNIIDGGTY